MGRNGQQRGGVDREIVERLGALPPLADRSVPERQHLACIGVAVRRPAGAVLHRRGGGGRQALLVLDGRVGAMGDDRADTWPAGSVLGGRRAPATDVDVVAVTDVWLLVFGPTELDELEGILSATTDPRPHAVPVRRVRRRAAVRRSVLGRPALPSPSVA